MLRDSSMFSKKKRKSVGNVRKRKGSGRKIELRARDLIGLPEERKRNASKTNKKVILAREVQISHELKISLHRRSPR